MNNPEQALFPRGTQKVQDLVNFIYETIPPCLDNKVIPINPIYSLPIDFSSNLKNDPEAGLSTCVPSLRSTRNNLATTSGG